MTSSTTSRETAEAPEWFTAAIAQAPEHVDVTVLGAKVHARVWGDRARQGLVLVHGGSAHSGWWDHIAPQLARSYRVVAIDLTGHGDSERREAYDSMIWSQEVIEVAAALIDGPPILVGHSMGGGISLAAAAEYPDIVAALMVIDTPLDPRQLERDGMRQALRPPRVYEHFEDAVARFRTIPEQSTVLPYVGRHVAEQSLMRTDVGWTWKYDPNFFNQSRGRSMEQMLVGLQCPTVLVRAELGIVTAEMVDGLRALVGDRIPVVELPQAGHHPMLDQPLALVASIVTALGIWQGARA